MKNVFFPGATTIVQRYRCEDRTIYPGSTYGLQCERDVGHAFEHKTTVSMSITWINSDSEPDEVR